MLPQRSHREMQVKDLLPRSPLPQRSYSVSGIRTPSPIQQHSVSMVVRNPRSSHLRKQRLAPLLYRHRPMADGSSGISAPLSATVVSKWDTMRMSAHHQVEQHLAAAFNHRHRTQHVLPLQTSPLLVAHRRFRIPRPLSYLDRIECRSALHWNALLIVHCPCR